MRWLAALLIVVIARPLAAQTVVHLEGEKYALERAMRAPDGRGMRTPVCAAPCDRSVPIGDGYRVVGSGVWPSKKFAIDGAAANLVVDPAYKSTMGWALGLIVVGAVGVAAGTALLMDEDRPRGGPLALAIGGGVVTLGGVALLLANRTTVTLRHPGVGIRVTAEGVLF